MSSKHIIVNHLRAVGMHHHGSKELTVNGKYTLEWEPHCIHDLGNAMAVKDHHGITRAYLARPDAYVISSLCYGDVVQGTIFCKPVTESHVEYQHLGPQHECRLKFKTLSSQLPFISYVLEGASINYSIV